MGKGSRNRVKREEEHFGPHEPLPSRRGMVADGAQDAYPHLGDSKAKGLVEGRCHICANDGVLEYGHVLPRWATKEWAGTDGAIALKWDLSAASPVRDGQKFYMLCGDCERRVGEGEGLLKRLQRDSMPLLNRNGLTLARGADGLLRVGGRKLGVLHRGMLGIALKLAITDARPGRVVSKQRIANARRALASDDFSSHAKPFAVLAQPVGSVEPWKDQYVVAGVSEVGARFTLGRFHWFVPFGPYARDVQGDLGWIVVEHEVDMDDPTALLWIEKEHMDPRTLVALAMRNTRTRGEADPRGF